MRTPATNRHPGDLLPLECRQLLSGQLLPGQQFETGATPVSVTTADFNGDGRPDLATADSYENTVSVLLGNGDGTFTAGVRVKVGNQPLAVLARDFDADGRTDLAVASYGFSTVSILRGNGDGTFASLPATALGSGTRPDSLAAADFNGDGKLDLAVGNESGNDVVLVVPGAGNGTFYPPTRFAVSRDPRAVFAGDFNGDGRADLATANALATTGQASVLLGKGDGTFAPATPYDAGAYTAAVGATGGDFNRDGRTDLAFSYGDSQTVAVLLNTGNGTFAAPTSYGLGSYPYAVLAGDFDGNGLLDLVVTAGNGVRVLSGRGDGTFTPPGGLIGVGDRPTALAPGDFNADGRTDLAVANKGADTVSVLLGRPGGTFDAKELTTPAPGNIPGDFNGDGRIDLAATDRDANTLTVRLGNGDGTFGPANVHSLPNYPNAVTPGDLNGDGRTDLAVVNRSSGTLSILLADTDGSLSARASYNAGPSGGAVGAGDVNGDGRSDLVTSGGTSTNSASLTVWVGDGTGAFAPLPGFVLNRVVYGPVAVVDATGDGRPDLVTNDANDGSVSVLPGRGDGTFGAALVTPVGRAGSISMAVGDVDADGRADVALANTGTNTVSVLLGNGDGTFAAPRTFRVGSGPQSIVAADIDGDGVPDLATANFGDGNISVLPGNGDGTFRARLNFGVGPEPSSVIAADFNGDGNADLATDVAVLLNNNDFAPRVLPRAFVPTPVVITLGFTENVSPSLSAADLLITPAAGGPSISPTSVTFDPKTKTARFLFTTPLPDGNYRARIAAAAVVDSAGNPMPGDFTADFFVLAGDANRDRTVNFADLLVLAKNYNGTNKTWADGDFNGDGTVNFADLLILAKAYNKALAAPAPLAAVAPAAAPVLANPVLGDDGSKAKPVFSTARVAKPSPKPAPARPKAVAKPKGR